MPSTIGLRHATTAASTSQAFVDEDGRLILPPDVASRLGFVPGTPIQFDEEGHGLRLRRAVTRVAKVYIEPTNCCNLNCRTCIRNVWDEPLGLMNEAIFNRLVNDLRALPPPLTVFFGGFGEPLSHPRILEMVRQVKVLGVTVELITNGTLLDQEMARGLIHAGLDRLWVSLDGATPDSYTDVRLGATLPDVIGNLTTFRDMRQPIRYPTPEIGIVFVAMQRNISDLPAVLAIAHDVGASRLMVSNVLPHTDEMRAETLYNRTLSNDEYYPQPGQPRLILPRIDSNVLGQLPFDVTIRNQWVIESAGSHAAAGNPGNRCPFIERGATAVGWDGSVSPCLPLLHSHAGYLNGLERDERRYLVGNLASDNLRGIWEAADYVSFRQRVQDFDFAPCTMCDGCPISVTNDKDCYGSDFPSCGGCLWAQGIVQCP
ncbi:MAG TPA: radical SAM protein [Aggregatilineaceae bacterium]|nr:radical SAM protein [Aggregatilineaceae bacterium]